MDKKRETAFNSASRRAILALALALGAVRSSMATTYTWTGGGTQNSDESYNWNDSAN